MSEAKVNHFNELFEPFHEEPELPEKYPWYYYDAPVVGENSPYGVCAKLYDMADQVVVMPPTCDNEAIVMNQQEWRPHSSPRAMVARAILATDNEYMRMIVSAITELPRDEQKAILEVAFSQSEPAIVRSALARIISSDPALEQLYSESS